MISVFYDDRCPICSREIEYYKNISPPAIINWCRISQNTSALEKHGITYIESLKTLHAINEGKTYQGVDTFVLIWQQLSSWKWLAVFVKLPVIYQICKAIYSVFARWRINSLKHCEIRKT